MRRGKAYSPTNEDREFVSRAVKAGATVERIAALLNIHDDTLRKYYRYELAISRQQLVNKAIGVIDNSLTDGSLDAAKYVMARVAGWTEKTDVTSSDGSLSAGVSAAVMDALRAKHGAKPD